MMSSGASRQLPLRIGLDDETTFANFQPGANKGVVQVLREGHEPFLYLWGAAGTGKTHLLQALCHQAAPGTVAAYLPLGEAVDLSPELLDSLAGIDLLCIDDVQLIAGRAPWEHALFHLYNRMREAGAAMVAAGDVPPSALGFGLADLRSRLTWGPVFQLSPLDDGDKAAVLQMRARARGLELPGAVADYLMRRCPRDMHNLMALLARLDRAALAAQRRLTVPFVRQVLGTE